MRRKVKRRINWRDIEQVRAYRREWMRRKRNGVSHEEYMAKRRAKQRERLATLVGKKGQPVKHKAVKIRRVVLEDGEILSCGNAKEYFSDMTYAQRRATMEILQGLGKS